MRTLSADAGHYHYGSRKWCYCKIYGCQRGHHGPAGQCQSCKAGQYQPSNAYNKLYCHDCPKGWYQNQRTQSGCKPCRAGEYSKDNMSPSCAGCPAGYYQGSERQHSCHACQAGKYQNLNYGSTCHKCPSGRYQSSSGKSECAQCPAGFYGSGAATRTTCTACPSGQYQDVAGSGVCTSCSVGKYNNVNEAKTPNDCKSCPAGRYGTESGRTSPNQCTLCVAGRFSEASPSGITACSLCPDGFASAVLGAASQGACAACPVGKTSSINRDSCTDCPMGKFRSGVTCLSCGTCTNGKQLRTPANLKCGGSDGGSCVTCPMGYFSPDAQVNSYDDSCTLCPDGWSSNPDINMGKECYECPLPTAGSNGRCGTTCAAVNSRKLGKFPNLERTDCRQTDQSAMEAMLAGATFGLQASSDEDENGRRLVDSVIRLAWNAYNVEEERYEVTLAPLKFERLFKDRRCADAFTTDAGQTVDSPRACAQLCYQTSGCEFFIFGTGDSTLGQCKFQMPQDSVCGDDEFERVSMITTSSMETIAANRSANRLSKNDRLLSSYLQRQGLSAIRDVPRMTCLL